VDDPGALWMADGGARLKAESAALFGQALDVVLRLAEGESVPADASFTTFHYSEGRAEKLERAQVVSGTCDRVLLKTLRGEYWSVPTTRTDCGAGAHPAVHPWELASHDETDHPNTDRTELDAVQSGHQGRLDTLPVGYGWH
jgi:hypothetical protein